MLYVFFVQKLQPKKYMVFNKNKKVATENLSINKYGLKDVWEDEYQFKVSLSKICCTYLTQKKKKKLN